MGSLTKGPVIQVDPDRADTWPEEADLPILIIDDLGDYDIVVDIEDKDYYGTMYYSTMYYSNTSIYFLGHIKYWVSLVDPEEVDSWYL